MIWEVKAQGHGHIQPLILVTQASISLHLAQTYSYSWTRAEIDQDLAVKCQGHLTQDIFGYNLRIHVVITRKFQVLHPKLNSRKC